MKPRIVLRLEVAGKAEPAGSKRAFVPQKNGQPFRSKTNGRIVVSVVDDNPNGRDWKNRVADAARQQWGARLLLTEPLWFRATFYLLRPKGHHGTGRNAAVVKESSPQFPDGRPDVLKLTRAIEDALSGVVWKDDSQIVSERIDKRYGDKPHVEIEIGVLPATLADVAGWDAAER
jgi:Holliday junction resolvase RusA-like endonuclease